MKKISILFLIIMLMVSIVSCDGKTPESIEYTVMYETNGGNTIESTKFVAGEKLELPEEPTKEDASFVGWYTDSDLSTEFDETEELPENDITLYAK